MENGEDSLRNLAACQYGEIPQLDKTTLENGGRDCRLLDFSGAALYSANLPQQSAISDVADIGPGTTCIFDALLRLASDNVLSAIS